jgi:hypothetical protein
MLPDNDTMNETPSFTRPALLLLTTVGSRGLWWRCSP